jgi:uncharacterized membrane protein YjfL (UPF0719 family)
MASKHEGDKMSRYSRLVAVAVGVITVAGSGSAWAGGRSGASDLGGGLLQLILAVIQLCISLTIVAFAITRGFALLSNLLNKAGKGLDLWQEIRNRNMAVALMSGAVAISYCNVIGSGIGSMSRVLSNLANESFWRSVIGLVSAVINLAVAIAVASFAITVVFKVMDRFTKDIDEVKELKENNTAVGMVYAGLIVGVSFLVSSGVSSIGMGVNAILGALMGMVGLT